jgi:hypothetical protein
MDLTCSIPAISAENEMKEPASATITGGKQGITKNPTYDASKSMVKAIIEHLMHGHWSSNPNISAHLLIPGWTFMGLSGNGRQVRWQNMDPGR